MPAGPLDALLGALVGALGNKAGRAVRNQVPDRPVINRESTITKPMLPLMN